MKIKYLFSFASVAALAALAPFTIASSRAASAPSTLDANSALLQQAQPQPVAWEESKRHKLRTAYWLIEHADRDYDGHRKVALKEVKKAGDIIGMDLKGDGYGGEPKWESDKRLREARRLLKEVREETGGGEEHKHLRTAIHEIDVALHDA
jgi:hypothetical protein